MILFMVNSSQRHPLPTTRHERHLELTRVMVVLDRVDVKRIDPHCTLEERDEHPALHTPIRLPVCLLEPDIDTAKYRRR